MSENNPLDNIRPPLNESNEFTAIDQTDQTDDQIGENQKNGIKEEKSNAIGKILNFFGNTSSAIINNAISSNNNFFKKIDILPIKNENECFLNSANDNTKGTAKKGESIGKIASFFGHSLSIVSDITIKSIQDLLKVIILQEESNSTEVPNGKRDELFITNIVAKSTEKKREEQQFQKLLKFFNISFFYLRKKNQEDIKDFFSRLSNKTETEEIHLIDSINDLNFSEIKVSKEEEMPKLLDDSYLIKNLVNPSFDKKLKIMNESSINRSKYEQVTHQLIKLEQLKDAERKKLEMEQKLLNINENINKIKSSIVVDLQPRKPNSLKQMILISDNIEATIKAEKLVRTMNKERREKEQKKKFELQRLNEEIKNSIEGFKKEKVDNQERVKYYKQKNIFERLEKNEQKKQKLVSSSTNNVSFIKKLYKSPKYYKNSRSPNYIKNNQLPSIFKKERDNIIKIKRDEDSENASSKQMKLYVDDSSSIQKPVKLFKYKMNQNKNKITQKKKMDELLLSKMEIEEKILEERERLIEEEKKILNLRKEKILNTVIDDSKNMNKHENKKNENRTNKMKEERQEKIDKIMVASGNGKILIKKEYLQKRDMKKMVVNKIDEGIQAVDENIDETLRFIE